MRSSLNQENCRYGSFIKGKIHRDYVVFANTTKSGGAGDKQWTGIVQAMKKNMVNSTHQIKREMRKSNEEVREAMTSMVEMFQERKNEKNAEAAQEKKKIEQMMG